MKQLEGRSALIVGWTTGIGRAVAERFAAEGAALVLADRTVPDAIGLPDALRPGDGRAVRHVACDVRDEGQVGRAVDMALGAYGQLDILVNNAGIGLPEAPAHTVTDDDWARVLDVNLRGPLYAIRRALPHMLGRRYGRIINTASQLAHKPSPWNAPYCTSKAALVALTVSLAQEVAEHGITVNAVCPGPTDTALWRGSEAGWRTRKLASLPIGRVATPAEIAGAYVFLASEDGSYMIGQSVSPNGGDVMW